MIRFDRLGVLVSVKASYATEHEVSIRLAFEVPEGKTVRLLDRVVELSVATDAKLVAELSGIRLATDSPASPGSPMAGSTIDHELRMFEGWPTLYDPPGGFGSYAKTRHASYWFEASASVPRADAFALGLPRFSVNDAEVELPEIHFSRRVAFYLSPLNC